MSTLNLEWLNEQDVGGAGFEALTEVIKVKVLTTWFSHHFHINRANLNLPLVNPVQPASSGAFFCARKTLNLPAP